MAILKDCYYESMDPISQMVEPLISPLLDIAEIIPHKYAIPFSQIRDRVLESFNLLNHKNSSISLQNIYNSAYLSAAELLIEHTDAEKHLLKLDTDHSRYYKDLWDVTMPMDNISFELAQADSVDFGEVILHLDSSGLKPEVLKSKFLLIFREKINKAYASKEQVKLLVDSLSLSPSLVKGKTHNAVYRIACELSELIDADKWRIRSTSVMVDTADAVVRILESKQGWGEDLANLVHLKIMTHSNSPIYTFTKVKE